MELLLVPIGIVASLMIVVYFGVQKMSKPERHLLRNDELAPEVGERIDAANRKWIMANDYDYLAAYQFLEARFCVWQKRGTAHFLIVYAFTGKTSYDMVTNLQDDKSLTSTINGDVGMFPLVPGEYKESIEPCTLSELFDAHQKSLSILLSQRGINRSDNVPDFEASLLSAMRKQMEYVKSMPFWPLRGIYWFFVVRKRMKHKNIEDQIKLGWI